eukprot:NODE_2740_length_1131_cov_44.129390_g2516_i0.p1 GENE.NODE_2740_length_1131_cov_44.129390_g2516_i0~~NODE_2740_length_1131_cov_44.129390_g2516_i0.p1  ORF type:complete len:256 (-),score=31.05 NODE_2740_length_1131_cov_44.129390_g2516_i0:279-1046(-)
MGTIRHVFLILCFVGGVAGGGSVQVQNVLLKDNTTIVNITLPCNATEDESNCTVSYQPIMTTDLDGEVRVSLGALGHPVEALSSGHLLVAKDAGGIFDMSVVFLTSYSTDIGATGLILNRPLPPQFAEELDLYVPTIKHPGVEFLGIGGPTEPERGFVLHTVRGLAGSREVSENTFVGGRRATIIQRVHQNPSTHSYRLLYGTARWGPLQLDGEIRRGGWMTLRPEPGDIFGIPSELMWNHLMKRALSVPASEEM